MFCKKKGTNLSKTPKKLNLNFSKLQSDLMSIFNFFEIIKNRITVQVFFAVAVQGVKVNSGKSLSSKFGRIQCLYCNKRYISRKLLMSAVWKQKDKDVAESWGCHTSSPQKAYFVDFLRARGVFLTLWLQ